MQPLDFAAPGEAASPVHPAPVMRGLLKQHKNR